MAIIFAALIILGLLVINEFWWRKTSVHGEFTRKFIHITVGTFVAFFPYFLSNSEIKFASAAFLIAVLVSKYFNIFKAIHSVQRVTEGEFWFALTVLVLAFLPISEQIFTVSLLVMALADGLAGLIGSHYGKRTNYKCLGHTKSIVGTATFFVVACFLLVSYSYLTTGPTVTSWYVIVALLATGLENVSYRGIDNLTVPLVTAELLYLLS